MLSELPALPKLHYAGPFDDSAAPEMIEQMARICGGLMVQLDWVGTDMVDRAVRICEANHCELALTYRPYSAGMAPTADPLNFGQLAAERDRLNVRLGMVTPKTDAVAAIFLECERWQTRHWPSWALNYVYNALYALCKSRFPTTKVSWVASGMRKKRLHGGFGPHGHFPDDEQCYHDARHVALYFPDQPELCRDTIEHTWDEYSQPIVCWLSLGCGWRWISPRWRTWQFELDYSTDDDAKLAQMLNNNSAVKAVCFYPAPFDARVPTWRKHFVAYVRGANNVAD